jgi:tRNA dimethylallyltransferase
MQNTLLVVLGPTGVGKTVISAEIALRTGSEIISCDSRQFYREMKIGTSVPDRELLNRIPHHFIGFLSVNDYYSASLYERDVLKLLPGLFSRNRLVIMTGGSGMYIDAVCSGIDDIPDVDPLIREKYNRKYREEGIEGLRMALRMLDPVHYRSVDLKNFKRIIRALEICETTGRPYSSYLRGEKPARDFNIIKAGLELTRGELYSRINIRVDKMVQAGLENEARELFMYRHLNALNTVGYKEFFEYFEGTLTADETVSLIKRNTRRYAKRQMTWWAKDRDIRWFNAAETGEIMKFAESITA